MAWITGPQASVSTPGISSSGVWSSGFANPMVSKRTVGWS